jgi:CDP-glycerol glycerophosphotransferase
MHDKLAYIIKHYAWVQCLYRVVMSFCLRVLGLFVGSDEHLVLLSSMSGDQFTGSPKVLFEAMQKDPRFADFHYVWAFSHPDKYQVAGAGVVKMDSFAYFKTALRAKVWITDVNIERGLNFKKKHTIYLNAWHGTGPKKGGNAIAGRKDYDFSRVDIFCCDGQYTHDVFIKWFGATDASMLWCGRPREDELMEMTDADRSRVRKELGIADDTKAILYMPTWREGKLPTIDQALWEKTLGSGYCVLTRAHHFTKESSSVHANSTFWKDVSDYPNVNELYMAADILISDYSSAFFDYGLLKKPMVCFAPDYDDYKANYGLFMDLEKEFPHGVMRSENDVLKHIVTMDDEQESAKCGAYCASYVTHDQNATAACMNRICELLNDEEHQ